MLEQNHTVKKNTRNNHFKLAATNVVLKLVLKSNNDIAF